MILKAGEFEGPEGTVFSVGYFGAGWGYVGAGWGWDDRHERVYFWQQQSVFDDEDDFHGPIRGVCISSHVDTPLLWWEIV